MLLNRLKYLLRRRRLDRELAEEIEAHRAMTEQRLRESGMSADRAGLESRRLMGNMTLAREDARTVWLWPWLESVAQDVSYTVRSLCRQPQFTLVAGGTLAAAIGLNTSLFTVYSAMAWRPWPVPESDRVFNVVAGSGGGFSYAAFRYLSDHSKTFEGLFAERRAGSNVLGEPRIRVSWVSSQYFSALHVPMVIGRSFDSEHDRLGGPAVAVLSHAFWRSRFNADPGLVGRTTTIDDVPVTIVGVASSDFSGTVSERVDAWLPLAAAVIFRPNDRWIEELSPQSAAKPRLGGYLAVAGRLASGVSPAQAASELNALAAQLGPPQRDTGRGIRLFGTAGATAPRGVNTSPFVRMFGGVLAVLLLACANVGNLLLARAGVRRSEIAVRLSLGASRARLVRQLLTESFTLALIAGVAGTLIALHLPRLVLEAATGQRTALQLRPDFAVMVYTLVSCTLACVLFGVAPALHATRGTVSAALKNSDQLPGIRFSLRSLLLSAQVALSVTLLVSAGLLIRGMQRAHALDHGFRVEGISVMSFEPVASAYDAARARAFALQLSAQTEGLAARGSVALAHVVPFGSGNLKGTYRVAGTIGDQFNTVFEVSPSYFGVLDIPIVAGRVFDLRERGVVLVNETLARQFGSPRAAVGRTISAAPDPGWNLPGDHQIVGVVRDGHANALQEILPTIYQPLSGRTIPQVLILETSGASERVSAIAAAFDPRLRVRIAPLSETIGQRLELSRSAATIAAALGGLALTLAAIGMFSVFAFWVQQRTKEIGIRMALGAGASEVVQLVMRSSGRAVTLGLVVGFAGAAMAGNVLRSSLYGVSTIDPLAYACVALLLAAASLTATFFPARRASRVDPLVALRYE